MQSKFNLSQKTVNSVSRKRDCNDYLSNFKGIWKTEHYRRGKLINIYEARNDICNGGKNDLLTTYFYGGTQIAANSWFVSLINLTSYTALAAADTMSSHGGWIEFTTYSQATRPAWGQGAPASQTITNASAIVFDISTNGTVKGIFVVSNSTKSGTTGILWSTALYSADVAVLNGDQIRSTYTLSC